MTADAVLLDEPGADWDEIAVRRAGGHVFQSQAWAEHRAGSGWRPRFFAVGGERVLALTRPWPFLGGGSAYVPRGPVAAAGGAAAGEALWAVTRALASEGVDVVAADPEVPADDEVYASWLRRARFRQIEELQPSRHRTSLPLGDGADEAGVLAGIAKSTRQRIRKAERELAIVRFDATAAGADHGEGFVAPSEPVEAALDRFYDLLLAVGERRHFSFASRAEFTSWWRRAHAAGWLIHLEARAGSASGQPVAGLVLYRHGGRLSTVHSGDAEASRREHPGALHLLRWRAIQLAVREGCAEMDLGGVDVAGARREPREGEPMYGLYQHKRSFGARWVELAGAHERIIHPRRYRAGTLVAGVVRRVRRVRPVRARPA